MSDAEQQPVVQPEVANEEEKTQKRQKNLEQLAIAREKAAAKKKLKAEEMEQTKQKLADLEARLTQSALAKKEASDSDDTEPDEPKKHVVTRQATQQEHEPSLMDEVKKNLMLGALGVASFLVARRYSQPKPTAAVIPHSPLPAKRPLPSATDEFIVPPPKRKVQPFAVPEAKKPLGASGFFL